MALKNKVKTGVADGVLAPTSTFLEVTIRAGGKAYERDSHNHNRNWTSDRVGRNFK